MRPRWCGGELGFGDVKVKRRRQTEEMCVWRAVLSTSKIFCDGSTRHRFCKGTTKTYSQQTSVGVPATGTLVPGYWYHNVPARTVYDVRTPPVLRVI